MVHFYYGNGKGKTTAALGLAMRGAGSGKKVLMFQFLKGNSSSERRIPIIDIIDGRSSEKFVFKMTDEERKEAAAFYTDKLCETEKKSDKYDMIILDEAADAAEVGFISEAELVDFIKKCGRKKEIVITGHSPSKVLIENSDYVTEMRKIKHPFDNGMAAREGIEF